MPSDARPNSPTIRTRTRATASPGQLDMAFSVSVQYAARRSIPIRTDWRDPERAQVSRCRQMFTRLGRGPPAPGGRAKMPADEPESPTHHPPARVAGRGGCQRPNGDGAGRYRGLGLFGMGWVVVASVLICMAAGWLIDQWLGTTPWFFIGLLLLGVVAGFVELIRMALRYTR